MEPAPIFGLQAYACSMPQSKRAMAAKRKCRGSKSSPARPQRTNSTLGYQTKLPKQFEKVRFGTEEKAREFWGSVGAKDFPTDVRVGIGIKPVSYSGSVRLVHSAISYAIRFNRKSVTLVHKGNIMKFTEGAFRDWGYEVAKQFFGAEEIEGGPWCKIPKGKPGAGIIIKDAIADITLQQVLTRPEDFDVIATLNLNGDYLSDALAAQVG